MNENLKIYLPRELSLPLLLRIVFNSIVPRQLLGRIAFFLGQVRSDLVESKQVTAIDYKAFQEMALEKMHQISEAIFAKHPLTCIQVYHSLGRVAAGEICLFVFTSARLRKAAIAACEEVVERIKTELPVWGKELFDDQSHQWKVNQ